MPKTRPNEPCPCESGKKFKKCCRDKPGSLSAAQRPKFSREFTNRFFARYNELKKTRLQTGPQIQTDTSFGRLFGVGGSLYRGETKRTFHQFLIDHLIQVLSPR